MPYLSCYYNLMKNIKNIFIVFILFSLVAGCQTIKEKTDEIAKKENEKLSKYIGKSLNDIKTNLGLPDEDFKNEKGNLELVYNSKKYLIPCERRFEINSNLVVVGFVSNGCF